MFSASDKETPLGWVPFVIKPEYTKSTKTINIGGTDYTVYTLTDAAENRLKSLTDDVFSNIGTTQNPVYVLKNDSKHSLKFFYAESGGDDSNIFIKFNLNIVKKDITYDGNGGLTPDSLATYSDKNHEAGETVTVSQNRFNYPGHRFVGWNTKKDGSGISYQPGTTLLTGDTDITLYAQWEKMSYTLTIDPNGGYWMEKASATTLSLLYSEIMTINLPVREHCSFAGWTLIGEGSTMSDLKNDKAVFTMGTEDATLIANWETNSYNVIYNANGGKAYDGSTYYSETFPSDKTANVTEEELFIFDGYKLLGWSEDKFAKKATYIGGDIIMTKEDITLYAIWQNVDTGQIGSGAIEGATDLEVGNENEKHIILVDGTMYYYDFEGNYFDQKGNFITILFGDVNCDGIVNMQDVTALQKIMAELATHESYGLASRLNSDCNHDGSINMQDVTTIQKFLAELIVSRGA